VCVLSLDTYSVCVCVCVLSHDTHSVCVCSLMTRTVGVCTYVCALS